MQAFHNWLFLGTEEQDAYSEKLVQLMKADPAVIAEAASELGWKPWESHTNEVPT
jgi:hypothetical protein